MFCIFEVLYDFLSWFGPNLYFSETICAIVANLDTNHSTIVFASHAVVCSDNSGYRDNVYSRFLFDHTAIWFVSK